MSLYSIRKYEKYKCIYYIAVHVNYMIYVNVMPMDMAGYVNLTIRRHLNAKRISKRGVLKFY